jgi:PAS domain S-box-containing protein
MSLKARLRIAIVVLVAIVVCAMSALYLYDFTRLSFRSAFDRADVVADEVNGTLLTRLNRPGTNLPSASIDELKATWTAIIRTDPAVTAMLNRMLANAKLVLAIRIADEDGTVLAASDPKSVGTTPAAAQYFYNLQNNYWLVNLWRLLNRSEDYGTTRTLGVQNRTLFKVQVVIRSDFVRNDVEPALANLAAAFASALVIGVFLGSVLPNIVLAPLGRMSRTIDSILSGRFEATVASSQRESPEFADVRAKLNILGEQFRGAKQDAIDLRSNIDQLLQRLEEAVLLFDPAGRLIMAGEPAERVLGMTHAEMMGRGVDELFPPNAALGLIGMAVRNRLAVRDQPVNIARDGAIPLRLLATVQPLGRSLGEAEIGTLITLRDVESRRQLERQLDLASRLAALSRLTSGVAHEIKNPLNAMALHLEVLKSKVGGEEPAVEVIAGEIRRLDTVVKTFLNYNKPIDLQAKPIDLNQLVEQVLALVAPEAETKHIQLESVFEGGMIINGDADLLKQAILNIVNNAVEAMLDGGKLTARTVRDADDCELTITDEGPGIAPEIQDRVFNLYFTTKASGSGIGLATTFRVVQMHSGTIDFVSERGKGTTFRLRFPGMVDYRGSVLSAMGGS